MFHGSSFITPDRITPCESGDKTCRGLLAEGEEAHEMFYTNAPSLLPYHVLEICLRYDSLRCRRRANRFRRQHFHAFFAPYGDCINRNPFPPCCSAVSPDRATRVEVFFGKTASWHRDVHVPPVRQRLGPWGLRGQESSWQPARQPALSTGDHLGGREVGWSVRLRRTRWD